MDDGATAALLLERIRAELGISRDVPPLLPSSPPLPSRLAVTDLAAASVASVSTAARALVAAPHEPGSPDRIATAYSSERWLRIDGEKPTAFAPLSGFFRTSDGWVRTHGNYPHHAAVIQRVLGLDTIDRDAAAAALEHRDAAGISAEITAAGGLCVPVAVEDRGIDLALRTTPLIATARLGASQPIPVAGDPRAPLRGIRVLDLTRVIAGPVGTRTLALLGAEVLRVDPPGMPELAWQHLDTGHGKRSALLDLATPAGQQTLDRLLARTDVIALGYRTRALARLGLTSTALAARHPGIIVAQHSAWSDPDRRGFDSLVQAASGIAWIESADGETPGVLPAQALDHSVGYLLAAGVLTMLGRRAHEGGSWLVETSLRRVAAELLGMPRTADPNPPAAVADVSPHVQRFDVAGSEVQTAAPALAYDGHPLAFASPRPWGQDTAEWSDG